MKKRLNLGMVSDKYYANPFRCLGNNIVTKDYVWSIFDIGKIEYRIVGGKLSMPTDIVISHQIQKLSDCLHLLGNGSGTYNSIANGWSLKRLDKVSQQLWLSSLEHLSDEHYHTLPYGRVCHIDSYLSHEVTNPNGFHLKSLWGSRSLSIMKCRPDTNISRLLMDLDVEDPKATLDKHSVELLHCEAFYPKEVFRHIKEGDFLAQATNPFDDAVEYRALFSNIDGRITALVFDRPDLLEGHTLEKSKVAYPEHLSEDGPKIPKHILDSIVKFLGSALTWFMGSVDIWYSAEGDCWGIYEFQPEFSHKDVDSSGMEWFLLDTLNNLGDFVCQKNANK